MKSRASGLTERINLRVSEDDLKTIRKDAEAAGLSVSETVRRRYLSLPVIARTDDAMIRELRRQGGLLKFALTRDDLAADERRDIRAILDRISALIDELAS